MIKGKKEFSEQDVIRLLKRWGERIYPYSSALQAKRRAAFLAAGAALLAEIGKTALAGKAGTAAKSAFTGGYAVNASMTVGTKIVLGVLATAILALGTYVGLIIYEEREIRREILQGGVTATPAIVVPLPSLSSDLKPSTPPVDQTGAATSAITRTPMPTGTVASTEAPEGVPAVPTKPGRRIGHTPRPERTPKPGNP